MSQAPTSSATRWWLLRHAPIPGPAGRINGRLDLPCDTTDQAAFSRLARLLPPNPILVESGLLRCRQTAGALESAGMLLPPPVVEPDMAEQDFGAWQGRCWAELDTANDPHLAPFWRDPAGASPPGGESFASVVGRVSLAMERLNLRYAGRDILAIVHAGTIRAALAVALDLSPAAALRITAHHLSMTIVTATDDGLCVECVNVSPQSYL